MFWWPRERVLEWLATQGVTPLEGEGRWTSPGSEFALANNDVAHDVTEVALEDSALMADERLALGFGLLDLLDVYAVGMYLGWHVEDQHDLVWEFCRDVLERPAESEAVPYWLWVDWFEATETSVEAFENTIVGWDLADAPETTRRRIRRVLEVSGPVPWATKAPVYRRAIEEPDLRASVLKGLRGSVHDVYGRIDRPEAEAMTTLLAKHQVAGARELRRTIRS